MKQYIQPQTIIEFAQSETMLAASKFDSNNTGNQNVIPSNEEYNGEFSVKGYTFGDDF